MITSGGVYTAVNNLDLSNIASSALVTESDQIALNDNDDTIPTSAAVKDYVDDNASVMQAGFTTLLSDDGDRYESIQTVSGTASDSGFIIASGRAGSFRPFGTSYSVGSISVTVGGVLFQYSNIQTSTSYSDYMHMVVPIAKNESYTITIDAMDNTKFARLKKLA
jgi:hypothetical protein